MKGWFKMSNLKIQVDSVIETKRDHVLGGRKSPSSQNIELRIKVLTNLKKDCKEFVKSTGKETKYQDFIDFLMEWQPDEELRNQIIVENLIGGINL